jgi:dTDP-4-dehydrorhamnose reductase
MLGRDVVDACLQAGNEAVALTHDQLDITDPGQVDETVGRYQPGTVVNCAAWTDVDGAEANERGAMRVNDEGAAVLAGAAASVGAKLVYVSSDYVFDGSQRRPYLESDLPAPISAYGRSKLAGETSVAVANPNHLIVRSSWLFGTAGSNFVETMLRVGAEQPEVLVVSDQVGCPTYTRHLAPALVQLAVGEAVGVRHVASSGRCSWFEFAQEIFDQAGLETRVMAGTTEMLGRPAPRPPFSVLASERTDAIELPDWRRGVTEYLEERRRRRSGEPVAGSSLEGGAG